MNVHLVLFITLTFTFEVQCFFLENLLDLPPDTFRNVSELISSKGYPVEEYNVITPDGYVLGVQRIPYGKSSSSRSSGKTVVLLMHGLLLDSSEFVINDEKQSLGFLLADQGYDVWMGNARGNTYSRRNVRLSPNENKFWDFSFDEIANIDLPSTIDFVLKNTGKKTLSYIGHSEGNLIAFALLSKSPEFNKKIKIFIALGPGAYLSNLGGLLGLGTIFFLAPQGFYDEFGLVEFLPHSIYTELFAVFVCGTRLRFICEGLQYVIFGYDPSQLNSTRLPVYFNHVPAGISTKQYRHVAQLKFSGHFQMFDYFDRNTEVYGQPTPPQYDLPKITTPTALISGINDLITQPKDVARTQSQLNSLVESYVVPEKDFNHMDYVQAIDSFQLVNKEVLSLLRKYGQN